MRLIQVTIPEGKQEEVLEILDTEQIDYVVTDETGRPEYSSIVYFPLPTAAVEDTLERLDAVGIDRDAYTVVVQAETVVSKKFDELTKKYAEKEESEERIARQELQARAQELAASIPTYVVMTIVSAVIATAGLLLNSPATVVGSMVIAPLIGPAMTTAVGTVTDSSSMFRRGVYLQFVGVVLSITAATLFAFLVNFTLLIPPGVDPLSIREIAERAAPNFLSLAIAIGAGIAGAVSLMTGISAALVGVMIAVALIPPAATVGIGLAFGDLSLALGSGVLVAVNVLSINLAALLVLWYSGYRPERLFQYDRARIATFQRVIILIIAILFLSIFLGGVTLNSYQMAITEENIHQGIEGTLAEPQYDEYEFIDMTVETRSQFGLFDHPTKVVVTVGSPPDGIPPGLASEIQDQLYAEFGLSVEVQVQYVTIERA